MRSQFQRVLTGRYAKTEVQDELFLIKKMTLLGKTSDLNAVNTLPMLQESLQKEGKLFKDTGY